jgi:hypothetical protein
MKIVRCKSCKTIIGTSDGRAFYRDGKASRELVCKCGQVRKFRK